MSIEKDLTRIATALETIAAAMQAPKAPAPTPTPTPTPIKEEVEAPTTPTAPTASIAEVKAAAKKLMDDSKATRGDLKTVMDKLNIESLAKLTEEDAPKLLKAFEALA